jgi:hypothetical protein
MIAYLLQKAESTYAVVLTAAAGVLWALGTRKKTGARVIPVVNYSSRIVTRCNDLGTHVLLDVRLEVEQVEVQALKLKH